MITKRIAKLWRAVVGSGLGELEVHHAEELVVLEREELVRKVGEYNRGLAGHAALAERLKREIVRLEAERRQLEPKLKARLASGDRTAAGRSALRLETIASELAQRGEQLEEAESTYRELVRAREVALRAARDKIEGLNRSIGDLRVQQALAELTELAAGMHGSIGLDDGTLDRLQDRVEDKRNLAAGRVRVARDAIDTTDVRAREAEQQHEAEAALLRYELTVGQPPASAAGPEGDAQVQP